MQRQQDIRVQMLETVVDLMAPDTVLDDRTKISDATRKRLADKGLQFPVPAGALTVVMMDDLQHTVAFPICADETCICHQLEYEQACADSKTARKRRTRKSKTLVNRTYEVPGSLAPVNQGFRMMR